MKTTNEKPFYHSLYLQVITAIILGAVVGHFAPDVGSSLKPLGDGFIKLIKMLIAPIIFITIVSGIAKMGDMKKVGRIGIKALLYFEVVSTFALGLGLIVVNLFKPGEGLNINVATIDTSGIANYATEGKAFSLVQMLLHIIPNTFLGAFVEGDILQVLLISLLFGFALLAIGPKSKLISDGLHQLSDVFFRMIHILMRFAPIGAFGAMAFTIGAFGLGSLLSLGKLMACAYVTCALFVFIVLGTIARLTGFSLWKFLKYIKEEILIVLGTSSSESALPTIIAKLEKAGCSESVVGLVIPTGYSFNLDGTSIYLTMAAVFVAQATNTPLGLGQQLGILVILLLTSKGAATVTGGGFITLAATLSATGTIPVAGLALLLGIDRFMSEARAITNLIGNGVATIVIAKWEKALDEAQLQRALGGETT